MFGFNGMRQLRHADVWVDEDRWRVVVGIRWAKNHQFTKELLTFPLPELPGSVLCLMVAKKNRWLVPFEEDDHLFQLPTGASYTYRKFQNKLREILREIGIVNSSSYSSHSFRCGGTTFSFLCGVPTEMIKLLGNWMSDVFLAYLEFLIETRTAACKLIKLRLMALE